MRVLMVSGGLDSSTLLASRDDIGMCVFVDYGQEQIEKEFEAVSKLGLRFNMPAHVLETQIPGEPASYSFNLSGRNTILATLGAAVAKSRGFAGVVMGINADDHEAYPDCRPEWVTAMNEVLRLSDLPLLEAPFLHLTKADIFKLAIESGLPIDETTSCYRGNDCGECGACEVRAKCLG